MKLTINEVAQCLRLPVTTVDRWIHQGRIPIQKSSNGYIVNESALEKWAAMYRLPFSLPKKVNTQPQEVRLENLLPAMNRGGVIYGIKGADVATVLKGAVEKMNLPFSASKEKLYQCLLEREYLTSTGIGKGVAIPHPHDPLPDAFEKPVITTCFLDKPIDFNAIDDRLVFVMFILLSPSIKIHLHLLSRLSFCVRDNAFVKFLKTFPDSSSYFSKIADFEKQLDRADNS
jgi:PTS system nitrogen regulatory IIA component